MREIKRVSWEGKIYQVGQPWPTLTIDGQKIPVLVGEIVPEHADVMAGNSPDMEVDAEGKPVLVDGKPIPQVDSEGKLSLTVHREASDTPTGYLVRSESPKDGGGVRLRGGRGMLVARVSGAADVEYVDDVERVLALFAIMKARAEEAEDATNLEAEIEEKIEGWRELARERTARENGEAQA